MRLFGKRKRIDGWRALTLDSRNCRVTHVQRKGGRPVVMLAEEYAAEGRVPDLLAGLSRQWQDEQYELTTCVEAGSYQLLPVEAPNVPKNELKSAIFWLIRDMVDFPMDNAVIDVLNIPSEEEGRKPMMYAVVAQSHQVRMIQERFEMAKLALTAVDIPEMAQRNIAALAEQPNRALAMVAFDHQGALLTITAGGELYLARRFDVSATELANGSDFDREHLHERIALEVQRSLDHFRRQFGSLPISRLLLAPCECELDDLASYLNENLDLAAETFDLASVFDFTSAPQLKAQAEQARYFTALGLGLRVEQTTL
jgi:MSHA biogenesis protein MshI